MAIDIKQLLPVFFEESFEALENMERDLLALEPGAPDDEAINAIFRAAHSIKGSSGTFGFAVVSEYTHVLETLLDLIRDGKRGISAADVDALLESVDVLREMLQAVQDDQPVDAARTGASMKRLEGLLAADPGTAARPTAPTAAVADAPARPSNDPTIEGWRIVFKPHPHLLRTGNEPLRLIRELADLGPCEVVCDIAELPALDSLDAEEVFLSWVLHLRAPVERALIDDVFAWVEDDCDFAIVALVSESAAEPSPGELSPPPEATPVAAVPSAPAVSAEPAEAAPRERRAASTDAGSIRVAIDKIDDLINKVGELVITQSMLGQFRDGFDASQLTRLQDGLAQLERNTRELQESVMQIRMLPISFSFNRFPRLVRDLCQKLGKQVELKMTGEHTELDKTVLEKIGDPLVHLVRNALDHGLELPEVRAAAGKPEAGLLHLDARHQGGNIVIEVRDDGAGLNRDRILKRAIERGLVGESDLLTDDQVNHLIFAPGFSTAESVSDVSGRGVGMDVVRRNIEEVGGSVEVRSRQGHGSTITIRLPLTLAILDGQLVRVGREVYVVPIVSILESLQVRSSSVSAVAGRTELYKLRDDYVPIVRLDALFGVRGDSQRLEEGLLVMVEGDGAKAGLFVDELLSQQQVVIKSLETNFRRVPGLSGATILGDGTVAMILDVAALVRRARPQGAPSAEPMAA